MIPPAKKGCYKVAYGSESEATSYRDWMNRGYERSKKRKGRKKEIKFKLKKKLTKAYHCPRCGFWHLTSQK